MKLQCPYCRGTYEGEPRSVCPYCGKVMLVPGRLRGPAKRMRRFGDNDQGEMTWQETLLKVPFFGLGSRPSAIIFGIAMVGMIALMIFGRVKIQQPYVGLSDAQRARQDLNVIRQALELYKKDTGSYPESTQGLRALVINPGVDKWNGEYVNMIKPDPWTHRYVYSLTGAAPTVCSFGSDGLEGTADDIYPDANALDALSNFNGFASQAVDTVSQPAAATNTPPDKPQDPAQDSEDTAPPLDGK